MIKLIPMIIYTFNKLMTVDRGANRLKYLSKDIRTVFFRKLNNKLQILWRE